MPVLWTFVQLDLRRYAEETINFGGVNLLRLWLSRSKNTRLHLCIEGFEDKGTYDQSIFPLSEIDLDRVCYFSLAYRGGECSEASHWVLKLDHVIEASVVGRYSRDFRLDIRMPQLRKLRLLVPELQGFVSSHPTIRLLTVNRSAVECIKHELTKARNGGRIFKQITILGSFSSLPLGVHGLLATEFVFDGHRDILQFPNTGSSPLLTCLTSRLRLRRISPNDFRTLYSFWGPDGGGIGAAITFLELTDLQWGSTHSHLLFNHLPDLVDLWIEDNRPIENDDEILPRWGTPKDTPTEVLDELPKFYRRLKSLSKITFLAQSPQSAQGLIEFVRRSNRKLEITVSSGCFTAPECEQLRQLSVLNVVVLYARRIEGIVRRTLGK
ncbi:hypothetical protein M408DRAFT_173526 [Serendipita vermifera MAFF 305830]|uniref:Uncharacterized protein n=1 Tax=Serendipita vermifera MAFF 305830 TaxID=933852 RepID=A0A0C3B4K9_SERVB|nr:hypothetical protein M408DRAFT_173526 [Serendipita vermifera MAFF 305830]